MPIAEKLGDLTGPTFAARAAERERALEVALDLFCGAGYWETSREELAAAMESAGVEMEVHFAGKEECFEALFDECVAEAEASLAIAAVGLGWEERLRGGLAALGAWVGAEPRRAWIVVVESHGPGASRAVFELVERAEAFLREGRQPGGAERSAGLEAGLVGGLVWSVQGKLIAGEAGEVESICGELAEVLVGAYGE